MPPPPCIHPSVPSGEVEIKTEGNIKGEIEGKIESEGSCLWVGTIGLVPLHYMSEVEVDAMECAWVSK